MAKILKIKLVDILINTENYRFDPVSSQKEAIDLMIEDQYEKLYNLAEHICQHGQNPNDKIQVIPSNSDTTKYTVVEGNRRVVSLKLLNNPDLIENQKHAPLKKKFKKLREKYEDTLIKDVSCTVYDNPSEAEQWIKVKHAGELDGIGTVRWNTQQGDRFVEKVEGKSSIALQTVRLLQNSPDIPEDVKSNLSSIKATNLDRLIGDPDVRNFLGIEYNDGMLQSTLSPKEVIKGLTHIAKDLLDPKFKVGKIYTKADRAKYLNQIPTKFKPDQSKKSSKEWSFVENSIPPKSSAKPKIKPNPKDRDILIPKSCALKISNPKVNKIYHELQRMKLSQFINAASVSLRVFIELSIDCYLEQNPTLLPKNDRSNLSNKIMYVVKALDTNSTEDKHIFKGIKNAAANKNDLVGLETWHAYVHNPKYSPTRENLTTTWDNIQAFMERIWQNIK